MSSELTEAAMAKLRKPSASAERGLRNVFTEMETIAEDMSTYKSANERQRGRDILAALEYLRKAVAIASAGAALPDDQTKGV